MAKKDAGKPEKKKARGGRHISNDEVKEMLAEGWIHGHSTKIRQMNDADLEKFLRQEVEDCLQNHGHTEEQHLEVLDYDFLKRAADELRKRPS